MPGITVPFIFTILPLYLKRNSISILENKKSHAGQVLHGFFMVVFSKKCFKTYLLLMKIAN